MSSVATIQHVLRINRGSGAAYWHGFGQSLIDICVEAADTYGGDGLEIELLDYHSGQHGVRLRYAEYVHWGLYVTTWGRVTLTP